MSDHSKPQVFIVESLNRDDEQDASYEGQRLKTMLDLSGKLTKYVYIRTKREFKKVLQEFDDSSYRYLHLSCHGGDQALWTTYDKIRFKEFGKLVRPYIDNRRVFISACQAASSVLASDLLLQTHCYSFMAPTNNIKVHDAAFFWAAFYHLMFKRNDGAMKKSTILDVGCKAAALFDVRIKLFVREGGRLQEHKLPASKQAASRAGGLYSDDWFPIQVKQTDEVGRPDIDAFQAVMERKGEGGRQRGFFVAFAYTKDAEDECRAFYKRTKRIIKLLTVQEILDEEHVQKM